MVYLPRYHKQWFYLMLSHGIIRVTGYINLGSPEKHRMCVYIQKEGFFKATGSWFWRLANSNSIGWVSTLEIQRRFDVVVQVWIIPVGRIPVQGRSVSVLFKPHWLDETQTYYGAHSALLKVHWCKFNFIQKYHHRDIQNTVWPNI